MAQRFCERSKCDKPHRARGLCSMHWKQEYGTPTRYLIICTVCEREHHSARPDGKFCSDDCKARAYKKKGQPAERRAQTLTCRICDASFAATYRALTCSPDCERIDYQLSQRGDWIDGATRLAIYERDRWTCQLCLEPVHTEVRGTHPLAPSLDHIRPRSRGGSDDPSNLRTAHFGCNASRGAPLVDEVASAA